MDRPPIIRNSEQALRPSLMRKLTMTRDVTLSTHHQPDMHPPCGEPFEAESSAHKIGSRCFGNGGHSLFVSPLCLSVVRQKRHLG
jgi:hypothetical protein